MTIIDSLVNDTRLIQFVTTAGDGGEFMAVGKEGITKIAPYTENGQMAAVPWLAIYKGDDIIVRVNCAAVEYIFYDTMQ